MKETSQLSFSPDARCSDTLVPSALCQLDFLAPRTCLPRTSLNTHHIQRRPHKRLALEIRFRFVCKQNTPPLPYRYAFLVVPTRVPNLCHCLLPVYTIVRARAVSRLYLYARQLGFNTLVKQLRARDINGAPLLFLAACSRSSENCFQTVHDALSAVLGRGEAWDTRSRLVGRYASLDALSSLPFATTEVFGLTSASRSRRTQQESERRHSANGSMVRTGVQDNEGVMTREVNPRQDETSLRTTQQQAASWSRWRREMAWGGRS